MAVKQFGDQNYVFGFKDPAASAIAASIGVRPTSISIDGEPEFEAEGKDEFNRTQAWTRGEAKYNFTLNGYLVDKTLFNTTVRDGGSFNYDGKVFLIKGGKKDVKNSEFQMAEITGVSFPQISDGTGTVIKA
jgi:hypothetical protein